MNRGMRVLFTALLAITGYFINSNIGVSSFGNVIGIIAFVIVLYIMHEKMPSTQTDRSIKIAGLMAIIILLLNFFVYLVFKLSITFDLTYNVDLWSDVCSVLEYANIICFLLFGIIEVYQISTGISDYDN